jgi:hypothetical protein
MVRVEALHNCRATAPKVATQLLGQHQPCGALRILGLTLVGYGRL